LGPGRINSQYATANYEALRQTFGRTGISAFNHSLRIGWREPAYAVKVVPVLRLRLEMTPEALQNLLSLALGFAMAGLFSSAYQLVTSKMPSFGMLSTGPSPQAFAAVPLLMIAAPFLIMRNTLLGERQEGRRFEFVFLATVLAGFWSLMSGMVLLMTLRAAGL
jgi:hypothetical protein